MAVVQPAAQAATTIRVDSLTPYQLIKPGPITVSGTTTGSPAGETVRITLDNDPTITVPVVNGRFSGILDTGPLADGVYTIYADVPDGNGYQFSAGTIVYVDEVRDDIVVTSPAPGSTVTSFTDEGLVITGRVAHPDVVPEVTPIVGDKSLYWDNARVAEDGTFRFVVDGRDVAQGPLRIAVLSSNCSDRTTCGALGTSAVTVKATPTAVVTAPKAGQLFGWPTSQVSLGLQVTNPGPADQVSAVIDGKLQVTMQSPLQQSPNRNLYWTQVSVSTPLGQGRHTLHLNAKIRGATVPVPDTTFTIDFAPPTIPVVTAPGTVLATTATVTWSATDEAGPVTYDVRWRTTSAVQATSGYVYPANLKATTATRSAVSLAAGKSYCFSARARDITAKTNDWSTEHCTLSPFDDRWLTVSKAGKRITWTGFYANTATTIPAKGNAAHTGVTATRVGIVARACPTCGSITVTHAGVKLGTVSLKASKPVRTVVWLPTGKQRTGTLTLTAPSGATLDAVYLRR
ncbi:hypothetical protein Ato02nite_018070 [Paractinoplanes toevensis]|uniref:Fibronectin type-III domain-containing protein n=1 Tax=Paractinoplanes toevensis TaxID=571911 RepID=A0A919T973_9ACTN|nr:hypothetical protein Ato02nite_018070 [Actinoplanes toevensis]